MKPRIGDTVTNQDIGADAIIVNLFDVDGKETEEPEEAIGFVAQLFDGSFFAGSYATIKNIKLN